MFSKFINFILSIFKMDSIADKINNKSSKSKQKEIIGYCVHCQKELTVDDVVVKAYIYGQVNICETCRNDMVKKYEEYVDDISKYYSLSTGRLMRFKESESYNKMINIYKEIMFNNDFSDDEQNLISKDILKTQFNEIHNILKSCLMGNYLDGYYVRELGQLFDKYISIWGNTLDGVKKQIELSKIGKREMLKERINNIGNMGEDFVKDYYGKKLNSFIKSKVITHDEFLNWFNRNNKSNDSIYQIDFEQNKPQVKISVSMNGGKQYCTIWLNNDGSCNLYEGFVDVYNRHNKDNFLMYDEKGNTFTKHNRSSLFKQNIDNPKYFITKNNKIISNFPINEWISKNDSVNMILTCCRNVLSVSMFKKFMDKYKVKYDTDSINVEFIDFKIRGGKGNEEIDSYYKLKMNFRFEGEKDNIKRCVYFDDTELSLEKGMDDIIYTYNEYLDSKVPVGYDKNICSLSYFINHTEYEGIIKDFIRYMNAEGIEVNENSIFVECKQTAHPMIRFKFKDYNDEMYSVLYDEKNMRLYEDSLKWIKDKYSETNKKPKRPSIQLIEEHPYPYMKNNKKDILSYSKSK